MAKNFLLSCILSFLLLFSFSHSQVQSYTAGSYYAECGQERVVCGLYYRVFVGYNNWGCPIFVLERQCKVEKWHSWYGTRYGYFWECDGYGYCRWEYRTDTRWWWYYTWYYYTERY